MVPLPDPEGPSMVMTGAAWPGPGGAWFPFSLSMAALSGASPFAAITLPLARRGLARLELPACRSTTVFEVCHEGPVLPEVGEDPSPRLQGRSSSRQGLRDLQVEPAFQGAPALSAPHSGTRGPRPVTESRPRAAFFVLRPAPAPRRTSLRTIPAGEFRRPAEHARGMPPPAARAPGQHGERG